MAWKDGQARISARGQQPPVEGVEKVGRGVERVLIAHQRADLNIEIRVVLCRRPDRENQVMRVHGRDFARINPVLDQLCLDVDQRLKVRAECRVDTGGTLDNFIGKQVAFARVRAAHLELEMDVCEDFFERVAIRIKGAQRVEPGFQERRKQALKNGLFGGKIIEQIGFAERGLTGNLINCRAPVAIG